MALEKYCNQTSMFLKLEGMYQCLRLTFENHIQAHNITVEDIKKAQGAADVYGRGLWEKGKKIKKEILTNFAWHWKKLLVCPNAEIPSGWTVEDMIVLNA